MRQEVLQFFKNQDLHSLIQATVTTPATYHHILRDGRGRPFPSIEHCCHTYNMIFGETVSDPCKNIMRGLIKDYVTLFLDPYVAHAFDMHVTPAMRILRSSDIADNPYVKNIHVETGRAGSFELGYEEFCPCEVTMYDGPQFLPHGVAIPRFGVYQDKTRYPILREGNTAWMTITNTEINTMAKPIADATGRVVTCGLGMGYFAYMTHLKPDVSSVIIVEHSQAVIDLFKAAILPQFDHPEKIQIVKADAFQYLQHMKNQDFDYCFIDIWSTCMDIDSYLHAKMAARHLDKTKIAYWIEDSLLGILFGPLAILITKEISLQEKIYDYVSVRNIMASYDRLDRTVKRATRCIVDILSEIPIKTPKTFNSIFTVNGMKILTERADFQYKPFS